MQWKDDARFGELPQQVAAVVALSDAM